MLHIHRSGLLTTVQDLGRPRFRRYGVSLSGAMDSFSLRVSNLLVGNPENAAALEATLTGPEISFSQPAEIAVCGGDLSPLIDGSPVPMWRPVTVKADSVLSFGLARSGCRSYIAVAGGISVPSVMGSASTFMRAGIGGFRGRALRKGDRLETGPCAGQFLACRANWFVSPFARPAYSSLPVIRLLEGRQHGQFDEASRQCLFAEEFRVTPDADRMGYRLEGPSLLLEKPEEMLSEAVTFGTVQVPPDGQPIVLMADCQTTGGYPKIGQVAAVDFPVLSQLKPGDRFRFEKIGILEAQEAFMEQERLIERLKRSIAEKTGGDASGDDRSEL